MKLDGARALEKGPLAETLAAFVQWVSEPGPRPRTLAEMRALPTRKARIDSPLARTRQARADWTVDSPSLPRRRRREATMRIERPSFLHPIQPSRDTQASGNERALARAHVDEFQRRGSVETEGSVATFFAVPDVLNSIR